MKTPELIALATDAANRHGLDATLVMAVVEQESGWNEYAYRYEPDFMRTYVSPLFLKGQFGATEAYGRSISWGLMQIMGQTARELGFHGFGLAELCAPLNGLEYGCLKLRKCMDHSSGDVTKALLAYNGGSRPEYASEVLARLPIKILT